MGRTLYGTWDMERDSKHILRLHRAGKEPSPVPDPLRQWAVDPARQVLGEPHPFPSRMMAKRYQLVHIKRILAIRISAEWLMPWPPSTPTYSCDTPLPLGDLERGRRGGGEEGWEGGREGRPTGPG